MTEHTESCCMSGHPKSPVHRLEEPCSSICSCDNTPIEEKTPEWFLARAAEMQEAQGRSFVSSLHDLMREWYPDRGTGWATPVPNFWSKYPEAIDAILVSMVCPVVCRGYLDGGENWHQLCLNKVQAMKEAMNGR